MNKITQKLAFLVILILTLTFTAVFAEPVVIKEDFSIRGGITFLMSASDIKRIEQENKSSVNIY